MTHKHTELIKVLSFIFPKANPDFDRKIDLVTEWYLEFLNKEQPPTREIGVNDERQIIMKMPYKRNCGYWTDNNIELEEISKRFNIEVISEETFEEMWKSWGDSN